MAQPVHPHRALLLALAGMTALSFLKCTQPKADEDETLIACSGSECADAAGQLAVGTPDCTDANECSSGVCLADVDGTLRCCEADCRLEQGRVCSTAGECVCSGQHRDVGGLCLLQDGEPCREQRECASGHCADGVCCDAACDGICEHCAVLPAVGTCSLYDGDPACLEKTNFVCIARNRCRLPALEASLACRSDADCDSDHCEPALSGASICCATECSGVCERCTAGGVCGFPPTDPACPEIESCPPKTTCLDYRRPTARECSSSGKCAECDPVPARGGIPCGIGAQCDGSGECRVTEMGRVAAGTRHTCAILDNGNVRCWGDNSLGQLGTAFDQPFVGDDETPASLQDNLEIDFARNVVQITAGFAHTCVLFEDDPLVEGDGRVRCWGRLVDDAVFGTVIGLLGTNDIRVNDLGFVDPLETGDVRLPEAAVQISAANGGAHTCAVLASGRVSCWGLNGNGQCGIGETSSSVGGASNEDLPNVTLDPKDANARAVQVSAGDLHTCALLSDGRVTCWGAGFSGQLGYGEEGDRAAPRDSVAIGEPAIQIAAGFGHTCAVLERGRVRCWGNNTFGTLGYGHPLNIGDDETPEEAATLLRSESSALLGGDALLGGGGVAQLTSIVDAQAVCARFTGGAVLCWGQNDRGQLGYGHTETLGARFSPDALRRRPAESRYPAGGDVALGGFAVALADGGRCALVRLDSAASSAPLALHCWGVNSQGQLGLPESFPAGSSNSTPEAMGSVSWE